MKYTLDKKTRTLRCSFDNDIVDNTDLWGWYFGGISPADFEQVLSECAGQFDTLIPELNSNGGVVTAGMAIRSRLKQLAESGIKVEPIINGVAASIASIIAISGTAKPKMADGTYLMIHNPYTIAAGDYQDLLDMAETLKTMNDDLAQIYADFTGKTAEEMKNYMAHETWFSAKMALENGFSTPLPSGGAIYNKIENVSKTPYSSKFRNTPESIAAKWANRELPEPPAKQGVSMNELEQFLNANPAAKAEYDKLITAAKASAEPVPPAEPTEPTEPVAEPTDGANAKSKAWMVARSNAYPSSMKDLAQQVIEDKLDTGVFNAMIAAFDSNAEMVNSIKAQQVTAQNPATPLEQTPANASVKPGNIKSKADFESYLAAKKAEGAKA